jgi:hypothetical protein
VSSKECCELSIAATTQARGVIWSPDGSNECSRYVLPGGLEAVEVLGTSRGALVEPLVTLGVGAANMEKKP